MNLIYHLIRKDIVRERWLLALWVALILARVGVGFVVLHTEEDWGLWEKIHDGLLVVQVVLGYGLVVRMVHADGLIGAKIAWATRPISGGRLLLAKGVGALLIFALLPVLLQLPWWLYCHFEPNVLVKTAVSVVGWQMVMIAAGFLVGSLTEEAGQVLLATLLLALGSFLWIGIQSLIIKEIMDRKIDGLELLQLLGGRLEMSLLGFGICAAVTVTHHFLTRRWVRSLVLAGSAAGLLLIAAYWSADYSALAKNAGSFARLSAEEEAKLAAVTIQVAEPASVSSRGLSATDKTPRALFFGMRVGDLPTDLFVINGALTNYWTWSDGVTLQGHGSILASGYRRGLGAAMTVLRREFSLPIPEEDPETARWFEERRNKEAVRREKENDERIARELKPIAYSKSFSIKSDIRATGLATMPLSLVAKARQMPPAYQAKVSCVLARPEVVVVALPLDSTTRGAARSHTVTARLADDTSSSTREVPMIVVKTTCPNAEERPGYPNSLVRWLTALGVVNSSEINFYFVNRVTGSLDQSSSRNRNDRKQMQVCGVMLIKDFLRVSPYQVIRDGQWVVHDPQWQEHSSLVLMRDRLVTQIEREVRTERFEIEPKDRR